MRPSTPERLKASLRDWLEMKETGEGLACCADEMIEQIQAKLAVLEQLLGELAAHGMGFTLKHGQHDAWGMICPDASEPGRYRWQAFRRDGFTGHSTFDSSEQCLGDLVDNGYTLPDPGALDRLADTVEWQRGMEVVAVIQACNAGRMSYEDALRAREAIDARYASGTAR
ncbi:hypothetical protein ACFSKY_23200 [Azotobacter chroococcum]|uniref:Uncharacterized protein n=1 Tax=Azotobacter chroococcum TaxID=353 RepID=A0A4R1P0A1_9GAMM|nr:hypothetical protein [Azotobacter chroococcum]TBV93292.1 hypothetical protein E0E53_17335 [Azotobacter chroococcum]TCL18320.1 hypothetical protein EV691_15113 [Azotobacter chroococcum]